MFEKVNPSHPDKIADRIAGALVDLAYTKEENPKIAVEVLIGHNNFTIITETSVHFDAYDEVYPIVDRIVGSHTVKLTYKEYKQDIHLANNQSNTLKCGDNGIFKGVPITAEQSALTNFVKKLYFEIPFDGKYVLANDKLIACQSNVSTRRLNELCSVCFENIQCNPLGDWTGGIDVDTGATNRKLGSDMGDSVTGGGLHGKDLSKADVSVNIYAFLKAQKLGIPIELHCAIGDETVDGKPYKEIVEIARNYIKEHGGFEKFAEWGLIR